MDKKILGVVTGIIVVVTIAGIALSIPSEEIVIPPQKTNEKVGLVINSPNQAVTLQDLDDVYSKAASSGIGRSNR